MKLYDISQEVMGCVVYPGDPAPESTKISDMEQGALYNLTTLSMCAHNGTHVDAPYHFIEEGKSIEQIPLTQFVGYAYVVAHQGVVTEEDAKTILAMAQKQGTDCHKRILIKGKAEVSLSAAEVFAKAQIYLLGNESQTVGPENAPMAVHKVLLGQEVVLLEGIRLGEVPEGMYWLFAAPLNCKGFDGAPCRAMLMSL